MSPVFRSSLSSRVGQEREHGGVAQALCHEHRCRDLQVRVLGVEDAVQPREVGSGTREVGGRQASEGGGRRSARRGTSGRSGGRARARGPTRSPSGRSAGTAAATPCRTSAARPDRPLGVVNVGRARLSTSRCEAGANAATPREAQVRCPAGREGRREQRRMASLGVAGDHVATGEPPVELARGADDVHDSAALRATHQVRDGPRVSRGPRSRCSPRRTPP